MCTEISWLELKEEKSGLNDEETRSRDVLKTEIQKIALVEEMSWRQNSKKHCLKEGSGNKKLFYMFSIPTDKLGLLGVWKGWLNAYRGEQF